MLKWARPELHVETFSRVESEDEEGDAHHRHCIHVDESVRKGKRKNGGKERGFGLDGKAAALLKSKISCQSAEARPIFYSSLHFVGRFGPYLKFQLSCFLYK